MEGHSSEPHPPSSMETQTLQTTSSSDSKDGEQSIGTKHQ
jgi:hypothetical protein